MKRKTISTLLIVTGIAIMCIPLIGRIYTEYRQDRAYDEYLKQMEQEMSAMTETFSEPVTVTEGAATAASVPAVSTSGTAVKKTSSIEGIIGRIKIPAISSDLLLLEGSSNKQLNWGAGHVIGTAMPGEAGNCAIAAHRNYTFGSYFSRLGEVGIGNEVLVTYKGTTYKYRVNEIFTITPDEVWVLGTDGSAIITLITCHPKGSNTQRLIVRGVLVQEGAGSTDAPGASPAAKAPEPAATEEGMITPSGILPSEEGTTTQTTPDVAPDGAPATEEP